MRTPSSPRRARSSPDPVAAASLPFALGPDANTQPERLLDDRLQRSARHFVAYSLALGHAPAEVIHAVRADWRRSGGVTRRTTPSGKHALDLTCCREELG